MPRKATGRLRPHPTIIRWTSDEIDDLHRKADAHGLKVEPYVRSLVARARVPKETTMSSPGSR